MNIEKCSMESFCVIGKEGSTLDGEGFIARLWDEANAGFAQVEHLAQRDERGIYAGFWGAMSDLSRTFQPWENGFSQGLYLAGVQCFPDAEPPEGWTKWIIPAYEYIYVLDESPDTFMSVIGYMRENGIELAGAAHDYICPETGKNYIFLHSVALHLQRNLDCCHA